MVLRSRSQSAADAMVAGLEKSLGPPGGEGQAHRRRSATRSSARVTATTDLDDLADVDLVIESVVEDLAVKKHLFTELDRVCGEPTILATNTSTLPVVELAMETGRPDRVCGIHFFNPAPAMALVEVVRPITASDETIAAALAFAEACGKEPVEVKDQAGFIVNALLFPYLNNAVRLLEQGVATKEGIDAAMKGGCGFPMGPFALLDLVGLDTSLAILDALYQEFRDPNYAAVPLLRRMVAAETLGPEVRARASTTTDRDRAPASAREPALDDADLLGPLHGPGLQRALPDQPGQGPDRPLDRLRPAHPDRLRPRRPRGRRARWARSGVPGGPPRPHAPAHGGHPGRRDEHLDDHQRHRGLAARPLRGQRRGPGRRPGATSPAPPRTTSSRST